MTKRILSYHAECYHSARKQQKRNLRSKSKVLDQLGTPVTYCMKKERFDFVFSLGSGCACSRMLRERGLQYASFPLDWVGGISFAHGAGEGVRRSAAIVAADFADWLRAEDLERAPKYDSSRFDAYYNRRNGLYFTHDVPPGGDVAACLPRILETYRRRIDRFIARASASKSILAVYVSDPRDPGEIGEDDVRASA